MVILHIASLEPSVLGGVSASVPQMIAAQKPYATLALINLTKKSLPDLPCYTVEAFLGKNLPSPFSRPDLVVFHEVYRPMFLKLYRFCINQGIPYVVIPHGCLTKVAQKKKAWKKRIANILLFQPFLKNAVKLHYLSPNEMRNSSFPYDSMIIGNGIQLPAKAPRILEDDKLRIVFIGRMEIAIKGLDLLLEAVKEVAPLCIETNTEFELYGPEVDGSHKELNHIIQKNGLTQLITIHPPVVGEEKKNILLSAHYFIQTSRSEGMPMGILEALSYGVPVIVTNGTGLSTIVEQYQAGIGCETTVEGITTAIKAAIAQKNNDASLSEAARALAEEHFDRNILAKSTIAEYEKLLSKE